MLDTSVLLVSSEANLLGLSSGESVASSLKRSLLSSLLTTIFLLSSLLGLLSDFELFNQGLSAKFSRLICLHLLDHRNLVSFPFCVELGNMNIEIVELVDISEILLLA